MTKFSINFFCSVFFFLVICQGAIAGKVQKNNDDGSVSIFNVDDDVKIKYKDLVDLILKTESMDSKERQYWFDIIPSMNAAQIGRLFEILDTERRKLKDLEEVYQKQIKALNERDRENKYKEIQKLKEMNKKYPDYNIDVSYLCDSNLKKVCFSNIENFLSGNNINNYLGIYWSTKWIKSSLTVLKARPFMRLMIDYSVDIARNSQLYESFFSENDIKDLIIHSSIVAIDRGYSQESIILTRYLEKFPDCGECYRLQQRAELFAALRRGDGATAVIALTNLQTAEARLGVPWLDVMSVYEVLSLAKDLNNRDEITSYLVQLMVIVSESEDALDKFSRKEESETEIALINFLYYLFRGKLSQENLIRVNDYVNKNYDKKNFFSKKTYNRYSDIVKYYLTGDVSIKFYEYFNDYSSNKYSKKSKDSNEGYVNDVMEGYVLEYGFYAVLQFIKQGRLDEAADILGKIERLGRSDSSVAFFYIEKESIPFINDYLIKERTRPDRYFRPLINSIEKTPINVILGLVGGAAMIILSLTFVFFPYSEIFRTDAARTLVLSQFNPLVHLARPLILSRMVRHCRNHLFPSTVRIVPFAEELTRSSFLRRHVPISLNDMDVPLHRRIAQDLLQGGKRSVLLRGEGGVGKSLTAIRAAMEMQDNGYVLIMIDCHLRIDRLKAETASALTTTFPPDLHSGQVLARLGHERYLFVLDNADINEIDKDYKVSMLISSIITHYRFAKVIVTSRLHDSATATDVVYDMTETSICFEQFLDGFTEQKARDRIALFRSILIKLRNPMVIALLLDVDSDFSDLVAADSSEPNEKLIMQKYVDKQLSLTAERFFPNVTRDSVTFILDTVLTRLSAQASQNMFTASNAIEIIQALATEPDSYIKSNAALVLDGGRYKGELGVLQALKGAALLVTADRTWVRFAHDRIYEFFYAERSPSPSAVGD